MNRRLPLTALLVLSLGIPALAATGCGSDDDGGGSAPTPELGSDKNDRKASEESGFPNFATKNTTRIGGSDPVAIAAAASRAVYPGLSRESRPRAVVLADPKDWRASLVGASLMSSPLRAPLLYAGRDDLPDATDAALDALKPSGATSAGGAQVIRVGTTFRPPGLETTDLVERDPAALAGKVDRFLTTVRRRPSPNVLVVSMEKPEYAIPAAGYAAKTGDAIFFTRAGTLPKATRDAIRRRTREPRIFVLGPRSVISSDVERQLRRLGRTQRIGGKTPVTNSLGLARYKQGSFGWGITTPGHGVVFARHTEPAAAIAASPLSSSGKYGPLIVLDRAEPLPDPVRGYLLDIQPGYEDDPVLAAYNHGWVIGDAKAISIGTQAQIDTLLETVPVQTDPLRQRLGS